MKTTVTLNNGYEMPILGLGYVTLSFYHHQNLFIPI